MALKNIKALGFGDALVEIMALIDMSDTCLVSFE